MCVAPPESDPSVTPVVPLHKVVGSLKCGLAQAIIKDREGRTGLLSGVAKTTLNMNVVKGRAVGPIPKEPTLWSPSPTITDAPTAPVKPVCKEHAGGTSKPG